MYRKQREIKHALQWLRFVKYSLTFHYYFISDYKKLLYFSVNVFVWRRGKINSEILQTKLNSIITYSLWDIYIERFLREQPVIIEQPSEVYVNPLCIQYLAKWIAFGAHISAPLAVHLRTERE